MVRPLPTLSTTLPFYKKKETNGVKVKQILTKLTNTQLVNLTFRFQKNFDNG